MADIKQQLAEERTVTAHERTLLAEERTFSAWARTGLASVATGFAIVKLVTEAQPQWLVQMLGVIFMSAGGLMFALGFWTYRNALQHMPETPISGAPTWILAVITAGFLLGTGAALALVFTGT